MHHAWRKLALGALIAVASGAFASPPDHTGDKARLDAQTVSKCAAAAVENIMKDSVKIVPLERKWRIDVEIIDSPNKSQNLSIDVEPIGGSIGGGGIYSYDCNTGDLKLIEGFR